MGEELGGQQPSEKKHKLQTYNIARTTIKEATLEWGCQRQRGTREVGYRIRSDLIVGSG